VTFIAAMPPKEKNLAFHTWRRDNSYDDVQLRTRDIYPEKVIATGMWAAIVVCGFLFSKPS
jgi:hypothetical protein